jgi:2-polyprenyl-6-methoxyphenol hydroxylase-like FAD-dependent oxidoreductase
MSEQQVLIVGGGPTGLCLALTLRRFGIKPRIIDRAPAPAGVSKALAVWSGSLEALAGMGVIDDFNSAGQRLKALCVGDASKELARLAVGEGIDSPHPFPLLLPQSKTEQILATRLAAQGIQVERGVELVGLVQDNDHVTATLKHGDGRTEKMRTSYVVGCDGARSFVRQTLGVDFEGYTEPQTFLLGDVLIDGGNLDHTSIYLWWHGGGTIALFPFGGNVWRIFAVRENDEGAEPPKLDELQQHADRHGPPGMRLRDPTWLSAFRINERLAAHYRVGRCFLAGDAAHIHTPAGGQGMNTGMQDAVNLGWKLAYALTGVGDRELLLASYEAERRPVARDVIKSAAQKQHAAFGQGNLIRAVKDIAVSIFGNIPAVQKMLQVELSETDIVYREGPLVALGDPPRRAGRGDVGGRARDVAVQNGAGSQSLWPRLVEPRHSLLVFANGAQPPGLDDLKQTAGERLQVINVEAGNREAAQRYHLDGSGWVLIRPDQVVAARGESSDTAVLSRYVDRVLRPQPM